MTMIYGPDVDKAIRAHAIAEYPKEACGIVAGGTYHPCGNVHEKPEEAWRINPVDQFKARQAGAVQAVVHSHTMTKKPVKVEDILLLDCPSAGDMRGQLKGTVPWGIVTTDGTGTTDPFFWGDQLPIAPLLGRSFRHGVHDCYSSIRDFYRLELKITLPEYPRDNQWWEQEDANPDLYAKGFKEAGFRSIPHDEAYTTAARGDVFLAKVGRTEYINHGGVYLGNSLVLNHLHGSLSTEVPIGPWMKRIDVWLKYGA